jgi:hypothetical protein
LTIVDFRFQKSLGELRARQARVMGGRGPRALPWAEVFHPFGVLIRHPPSTISPSPGMEELGVRQAGGGGPDVDQQATGQ